MINKITLKNRLEELFYIESNSYESYERMLQKSVKHYDESKDAGVKVDSEICELANLMFSKKEISETYKELLTLKDSIKSKKSQLMSYANNLVDYSNCYRVADKQTKKKLDVKIATARHYYEGHQRALKSLENKFENFGDFFYNNRILND